MQRVPTLKYLSRGRFAIASLDCLPKTSDGTSRVQICKRSSSGLESTTKTENDGTNEDGPSAAKLVTSETSQSSTEEGAAREYRHYRTGLVGLGFEFGIERLRGDNLRNNTQIVTVKEGSKGGEKTNQKLSSRQYVFN